jgi:hypothetical protein
MPTMISNIIMFVSCRFEDQEAMEMSQHQMIDERDEDKMEISQQHDNMSICQETFSSQMDWLTMSQNALELSRLDPYYQRQATKSPPAAPDVEKKTGATRSAPSSTSRHVTPPKEKDDVFDLDPRSDAEDAVDPFSDPDIFEDVSAAAAEEDDDIFAWNEGRGDVRTSTKSPNNSTSSKSPRSYLASSSTSQKPAPARTFSKPLITSPAFRATRFKFPTSPSKQNASSSSDLKNTKKRPRQLNRSKSEDSMRISRRKPRDEEEDEPGQKRQKLRDKT